MTLRTLRTLFGTGLLGAGALVVLPGCLDLKPDAAPLVRWLTVGEFDSTSPEAPGAPAVSALRLGRIHSSDGINDRLMRRQSPFEVVYDDQVRWIEPPALALQRGVEEELFRRRGFVRDERAARRLDVELLGFEERIAPRHEAVVSAAFRLSDESGTTLLDRRLESRQPIAGDKDPADVAEALSKAMSSVVAEMADFLSER